MTYPANPTMTAVGARLRERTQWMAVDDASYGYSHAYLCEALGRILLQVQQIADPDGDIPPLAPLVNPDLAPDWALPWVAQLVGLTIPAGTPPDAARTLIRETLGFRRGTVSAISSGIAPLLTGSKTVYFRERDGGDPYALEIVTQTSETPDPAAVQRAIIAQKPAGLVLSYRTIDGWDYEQMTLAGGIYSALPATYPTYSDLQEGPP